MSQDGSSTQRAAEGQLVNKLGFWHYVKRLGPLCAYMGFLLVFMSFLTGTRFGSFWAFLLRVAIMVAWLWLAVSAVSFLHGRVSRRRIRDKESAWKTDVENRVQLGVPKAEAMEHALRLLSGIRAKAITSNADAGVLTARTGGYWRGTTEAIELAFVETEDGSMTATVKSTAVSTDSLCGDDYGRNAWNVQRLCDRLAELNEPRGSAAR